MRQRPPSQTVDKPMRQSLDTHGGIVKGGGYAPLHVQSMPKWELFRKFPFWRFKLSTLCRQLEAGDAEASSVFLRRQHTNRVIASQCAHWRGNPFCFPQ